MTPVVSIVLINKNEPTMESTLRAVLEQATRLNLATEVIVIDASAGRFELVRARHADAVRWIDFIPPDGVRVSIPHQRNMGVRTARGDIIVFTDAGCAPHPHWLATLIEPIVAGREDVVAGGVRSQNEAVGLYDSSDKGCQSYLAECPTINVAFRRAAYDAVGGFDERFEYGSDIDFSWRLRNAGYRIYFERAAVVRPDWGTWRRQLRRSRQYGRARLRLYHKHRDRIRHVLRDEPVLVLYSLFLVLSPLAVVAPWYLLLLAIPLWRNRHANACWIVVNHFCYATGALQELISS